MKKVDAELLERLKADPEAEFRLIVKTEGEPGQYLNQLQALDIEVRRKFKLTRSLAITGQGIADSYNPEPEPGSQYPGRRTGGRLQGLC